MEALDRIFSPEKYLVGKKLWFYFENNRLIYRVSYKNLEIDFTDKEQYKDFVIHAIDKNLPVQISEQDLKNIIEFQDDLLSNRKLKIFVVP